MKRRDIVESKYVRAFLPSPVLRNRQMEPRPVITFIGPLLDFRHSDFIRKIYGQSPLFKAIIGKRPDTVKIEVELPAAPRKRYLIVMRIDQPRDRLYIDAFVCTAADICFIVFIVLVYCCLVVVSDSSLRSE